VANAEKDREIGLAAATREKSVSIANLEKEQQVGQQTAAFEQEVAVKNAEQLKRIAVAEANAKAVAGEADSQARIVGTQAQLKVKQADAFRLAETASREAEAAVAEAQHKAQTRAALAQAERVEAERRAEFEAPAKAEKARMIVEAEARAEQVRLAARAEADAIRMKLEAEAEGQYQILQKRSEAMGDMVRQAGGAKEAFQLMLVEQIPQLAETAAKAISNIKFDKVVVWEGGNSTTNGVGSGATANFVQSLARSVPPIMSVLKEVAGVELPSYLGTMTPEPAAVPPEVATPASVVAEVQKDLGAPAQ